VVGIGDLLSCLVKSLGLVVLEVSDSVAG
jgi:hypothetical protein